MQQQRDDQHTARDQARQQFMREGTTSRGHLSAAALGRVDRLVVLGRPALPDVAVANWEAIFGEVIGQGEGNRQGRDPETRRAGQARGAILQVWRM